MIPAAALLLCAGLLFSPSVWVAVALTAVASFGLIRVTRDVLALSEVFPELTRHQLGRLLAGASGPGVNCIRLPVNMRVLGERE